MSAREGSVADCIASGPPGRRTTGYWWDLRWDEMAGVGRWTALVALWWCSRWAAFSGERAIALMMRLAFRETISMVSLDLGTPAAVSAIGWQRPRVMIDRRHDLHDHTMQREVACGACSASIGYHLSVQSLIFCESGLLPVSRFRKVCSRLLGNRPGSRIRGFTVCRRDWDMIHLNNGHISTLVLST